MLKMAPRRINHHPAHNGVYVGNIMDLAFNIEPDNVVKCARPTNCIHDPNNNGFINPIIRLDDVRDAVRVVCNNENCTVGQYMHRECFEDWEKSILLYLKTCGRARSWSERQRLQNLWTKKGYDLAFKACSCKCGRGHLRKDLDWGDPTKNNKKFEENGKKKRKNKNRNNNNRTVVPGFISDATRIRTGSLSSSNGSTTPPVIQENAYSPNHAVNNNNNNQNNNNYHNNTNNNNCGLVRKKSVKIDLSSEKAKNGSAGNGIFCRRQDFSAFNDLPWHKLNSYHIKMEDDGNHGNDDTRCFILSTLAGMNMAAVNCVLCGHSMEVYDRYPLVNGTFFLSPRQHSRSCLEVKLDGRTQFLSAACLFCLEGLGAGRRLNCLYCASLWDGSNLVLGGMYSYDIFAAKPCCTERLRCNNCQKPLLMNSQRLVNFSDYSHSLTCPLCQAVDTHFVKPLTLCYTRNLMSP